MEKGGKEKTEKRKSRYYYLIYGVDLSYIYKIK